MFKLKNWVLILVLFSLTACSKKPAGPTIWIYTSIYNFVVRDLNASLKKQFPHVNFKWYQSGSENVAAKVAAELLSGRPQADLILTSDLFWYEDLAAKHKLLKYDSPEAEKVAPQFRDPNHYWGVPRASVMVIAYNKDDYTAKTAPKSFVDLTKPRFKNRVAMPSPLESGTTFTTVAFLSHELGWSYFKKLRANGAISAGGNSAVIAKLESRERPVGIVLLENILAVQKRDPKIAVVYPKEGAITIPGPIAILASTKHPAIAKKVYDFFFSPTAVKAILKGDMHTVGGKGAAPRGAHSWQAIVSTAPKWSPQVIQTFMKERETIKRKFSKIMLE